MSSLTYALIQNILSDISKLKNEFNGELDNHFSVIKFDAKAGFEDAAKEKTLVMKKSAGA